MSNQIFTNAHCVGCNCCILACPCAEANVAQVAEDGRKVWVDETKCINCGACVMACTHEARDYTDDTERFLGDLKAGKEISLITAPALRSNVAEWPRLLGCLKSLGVTVLYDASFGADICTWGYLRHMEQSGTRGLIAQPCPAVVGYVERYVPELIYRLSPVHSPVLCAAIYMKEYKKIPGEMAFLSPCVAKGTEFADENTSGYVGYNVTFKKLLAHLAEAGIDYLSHEAAVFDNPPHGPGAVYANPGGLKANVERHVKGEWIYKTEGQPHAAKFLHTYANQRGGSPFLLDILSCAGGCNTGPGACKTHADEYTVSKAMFEVEKNIQPEKADFALFDKELKLEDFKRQYTPRKIMSIFVDRHEMENAFAALNKPSHEFRTTDCRYCGYHTCQEMAVAVAKGINHVENCTDYLRGALKNA